MKPLATLLAVVGYFQVTSVSWRENELNMVDTPGHADFGGEVCGPHIIFYDLDQNVDFDVMYNMIVAKFVAG